MKTDVRTSCSFSKWYPQFRKNTDKAVILPIPDDVLKYLEHEVFVLPKEATCTKLANDSEWSDGSAVIEESDENEEEQPTFPEFSKQIQEVIDDFKAVFVKSNWSSPSDATWVSSTKSLKCSSLEDVYLLLKSSDRVSEDLNLLNSSFDHENPIKPCLVLKKWYDIDPCTEFRCFVINKELVGICQRDTSQYYKYIESEKYNIQSDIKSLFMEYIKDQFSPSDYTFDVIRLKKDKVKILDFGLLNQSSTEGTLFTLEELQCDVKDTPEFRFIAENVGIQPSRNKKHMCIPQEINEYFKSTGGMSVMDMLRKEVKEQGKNNIIGDHEENS